MQLRSGNPLWLRSNTPSKHQAHYPRLRDDHHCDVAVVGGGIVGALLAYYLSKKSLAVTLVDRGEIGRGSTAASTALLMYQLDVPLSELSEKIGKKKAVRAYQLSHEAVPKLKALIKKLGADCQYTDKKLLYLASKPADLQALKDDYAALWKNGFEVELLEKESLRQRFGLEKEGAILSSEGAEVNPYLLTQALIRKAHQNGVKVYTGTEVVAADWRGQGQVLRTAAGHSIRARQVIMATGYESQRHIPKKIVELKSSYVIASRPLKRLEKHWLKDHLVWETARPYLYVRSSCDSRLLVGGEDLDFIDPRKRDALIPRQSQRLQDKFGELVGDLSFKAQHAWAGTFGETQDGLGYVGCPPGLKEIYFALGFGGNGITSGLIATEMILELLAGKRSNDQQLFSFLR